MFWDDKIVSMEAQIAAQKRQIEAANAHRDAALTEHAAMKTERDALTKNVAYWQHRYELEQEENRARSERLASVHVTFVAVSECAYALIDLLERGSGYDSPEYLRGVEIAAAAGIHLAPEQAHDAGGGGGA